MPKMTGKEILSLVQELVLKGGLQDASTIAFAILQREAEAVTDNRGGIEEMNHLETLVVQLKGYYREERAAEIEGIQPTYMVNPSK